MRFDGKFKQATLDAVVFGLAQRISERETMLAAGNAGVAAVIDEATSDLLIRLDIYLAGGRPVEHSHTERVSWPADWRQAFKARWFDCRPLRWLLRRCPVVMAHRDVPQRLTVHRVCPHLPIPSDASGSRRRCVTFLLEDGRL